MGGKRPPGLSLLPVFIPVSKPGVAGPEGGGTTSSLGRRLQAAPPLPCNDPPLPPPPACTNSLLAPRMALADGLMRVKPSPQCRLMAPEGWPTCPQPVTPSQPVLPHSGTLEEAPPPCPPPPPHLLRPLQSSHPHRTVPRPHPVGVTAAGFGAGREPIWGRRGPGGQMSQASGGWGLSLKRPTDLTLPA